MTPWLFFFLISMAGSKIINEYWWWALTQSQTDSSPWMHCPVELSIWSPWSRLLVLLLWQLVGSGELVTTTLMQTVHLRKAFWHFYIKQLGVLFPNDSNILIPSNNWNTLIISAYIVKVSLCYHTLNFAEPRVSLSLIYGKGGKEELKSYSIKP